MGALFEHCTCLILLHPHHSFSLALFPATASLLPYTCQAQDLNANKTKLNKPCFPHPVVTHKVNFTETVS